MSKDIVEEGLALFRRNMFDDSDIDDLFKQAAEVVIQYDRASASLIQRRLSEGYARAARLIDQLESAGVLGPADGSKPRAVLITSVANIKEFKKIEEEQVPLPVHKYTQPKVGIVKKQKGNNWKKSLYDIVNESDYKNKSDYEFPLGYDKEKLILKDFRTFTHLSITGNISSQKEVLLDTIIISLILKLSHQDLKLILIDQTGYLSLYDGLQHLLTPVITDYEKPISALRWTMSEMDRRKKLFIQEKVRDIEGYNKISKTKLERILIIINRFDDGILFSPVEIEDSVTRLTSLAHKTGIHLIITTDRLTNQEVPPKIQSNLTNKLFFRLTSKSDSGKTKVKGMDKLGKGEAVLISDFGNEPIKLESIYTSEENVKSVIEKVVSSK